MSLKNKTVFVTGSSRGIGKAIAVAFAKEGANIVLNARTNVSQELVAEIESYGVQTLVLLGDVSDFNWAKESVKTIKDTFGTIDVVVNNAGITRDQLLLRMSEDDFDVVQGINLKGAFNILRHVAPVMLKQRSGAIINVSSVVGQAGNIGQVNYSASKAGLIGMTKSAARELASRGVTVNAIAPGYIESDMTDVLSEDVKKAMIESIPLKRIGYADEIAQATLYLAQAKYVTGQVLAVNGGMYM
ncbi:3-oxoacyl-[acyl-carrier-protein] reductase [Carnobacteriaceae bacterium zg-ZUI252]|nr:3-oxoacyl-[acyl-carrier-protein] reductase [Carnobacteriaceae bacterium zg-ZUI252]